jgi:four helix bundle protein
MHDFKKLEVWKKSIELALLIYKFTAKFPREEIYGLTSQIRRCSVSIGSNIAEGAGRGSILEFRRFIHFGYGSSCELYTQSMISKKLKYISQQEFEIITNEINEIQKMLYSLINSLN